MGKLGCDPSIHHFSHPHQLQLNSTAQHSHLPSPCSGCKLPVSGWFYACEPCNHSLHISCAQMPTLIHHPYHPPHPLSLLPLPAYPQGFFNCDACGKRDNGFSYHCGACDLDLHILCAAKPLSLYHPAHLHPLALEFSPPYQNKGFSCDICSNLGSNHWLYRCAACEFDAHIGCAASKPRPVRAQQLQMGNRGGVNVLGSVRYQVNGPLRGGLTYDPGPAPLGGVGYNMSPGWPMGVQAPGSQRGGMEPGNNLLQQAMQGAVDGASQQMGQDLVQSLLGLGGRGGGGGGASQQMGLDLVQNMLGLGGGGGLGLVQSVLGLGGSGGGGADGGQDTSFLSAIGSTFGASDESSSYDY